MRNVFIAGNWKMHKTVDEAVSLASSLVSSLGEGAKKIMIAPPFTALASVYQVVKETNILLGAQNMASEEQGAHTGEVSVLMLADTGVSVVILGHSERRHIYGEDDESINRKVKLALKHNLEVILCVGETLAERDEGITRDVIERQVNKGLEGIPKDELERITIAYEPVWAIGTGKTATARDADEIHLYIRNLVSRLYSRSAADNLVIQYGGSVKAHNSGELMSMDNIDGLLVGGASLAADSFTQIVKYD